MDMKQQSNTIQLKGLVTDPILAAVAFVLQELSWPSSLQELQEWCVIRCHSLSRRLSTLSHHS